MEFLFVRVVPKNFELFHHFSVFITYIYVVISSYMLFLRLSLLEFTSRPLSLLASIKASVFFFTLCILPPNILTLSA